MTYADALKLVAKARCKYSGYRLPGREGRTRLVQRSSGIAIKYTNTDVVTIHPDDSVTLNSGGWNTKTTRDRMGYAEPVNVFTVDGHMYVSKSGWWYGHGKAYVFEFKDGMIMSACGTKCLNAVQLGVTRWSRKAWQRHVKDLRNAKARERRRLNKERAERHAEAMRLRNEELAARETHIEPKQVVNEPVAHVRRTASELRSILSVVRGGK